MARRNQAERFGAANPFGVTDASRVWVGGHDRACRAALEDALPEVRRPPSGAIDTAFITPQSVDEATYFTQKIDVRLAQDGAIWVTHGPDEASDGTADAPPNVDIVSAMRAIGFVPDRTMAFDRPFRCTRFVRHRTRGAQ